MQAQANRSSPVGEYYLHGVPETASGFKLNKDSSFQFFFTYGALDRSGTGRWQVEKDTLVLNSGTKPAYDFKLLSAATAPNKNIVLQLKNAGTWVLPYFHCKITGGGKTQEAATNAKGRITFQPQTVDSIELGFEFCPEKKSVFAVRQKAHNYFVFSPEPWLMDVFFQNFRLRITANGLQGAHPLLNETSFEYEKQR